MAEPLYVIFNPHSGKGRGAQLVAPVLAALSENGRAVRHDLTTRPGEESDLAARAIDRGVRTIVAVGGDGTWSNVANGALRTGRPATLGFIPGGTGCDFARSLAIPQRDVRACARIICGGHERAIDVGRVEGRHFLNIVGFGYDVAVLEDSWNTPYLEGSALYLYCALKQLGSFSGFSVRMKAGAGPPADRHLLMLIIANARVFGGGFRIAPQADLDDGQLDAVAFSDAPFFKRLSLMQRLRAGTHLEFPEVQAARATSFTLKFAAPPAYETDGEWNKAKTDELIVETVPRALRVLVPSPTAT